MSKKKLILIAIVALAALLRFVPHPPNFTPVIAISVLSVTLFDKKHYQFGFPLLIMLITDAFLGFHKLMPVVYGALALAGLSGYVLKKKINVINVLGSSFLASCTFFIVTNFGVWLMSGMYTKTFAGLTQCFVMAIPFFHNSLFATVLVICGVYGLNYLAQKLVSAQLHEVKKT